MAIIGGGNTATDSARVALRMGAHQVHMFYRREKKDMPAIEEEIVAVEEEGIHIHELTAPTRVLSQEGKVTGLELIRMELGEFDKSGRKTPRKVKGSEYSVACDTVIQAIGQGRTPGSWRNTASRSAWGAPQRLTAEPWPPIDLVSSRVATLSADHGP